MSHPFAYAELHAADPRQAGAFYADLFGWKVNRYPLPGKFYAELATGEGFPGGLTEPQPELQRFAGWLSYVRVDDLEASVRRARELGATVVKDAVVIPDGGGRYGWILDPAGAPLGLWEQKRK